MFRLLSTVNRHLMGERDRFVLWVPVLIGIGVIAYFSLNTEPQWWLGIAAMLGLCMANFICNRWKFRFLLLPPLLLALGFTAAQWRTHNVYSPVLQSPLKFVQLEGVIEGIEIEDKGGRLILSELAIDGLQAQDTPNHIQISIRKIAGLHMGDKVRFKANLFPLPMPVAPGAFDFARYLYFQGIGAVGYAVSRIEVLGYGPEKISWLAHKRVALTEELISVMGKVNGAVAAALTVGEMSAVPETVRKDMRDSGLYHILSISGVHLSIAAGIVFFSLRLMLVLVPGVALHWPVKKLAALGALAATLFYLLIAGNPVSAQRSFVMVASVLIAILFDRQGISIYALAWAAIVILLFQPESVMGASFHMSFAATLAIVALYERYSHVLSRPRLSWFMWFRNFVVAGLLVSLAATLATAPFVIAHFNRFQAWGILANLLVEPVNTFLIMPGIVIAFLLLPFGLQGCGYALLGYGIKLMLIIAEWVAGLPYASITVPPLSVLGLSLCALGLLWLTLWRGRMHLLGLPFLVAGLFTMCWHQVPDMLVSADAKQVMARNAQGEFVMLAGTARNFTATNWLHMHGAEKVAAGAEGQAGIDCVGVTCHYRLNGAEIVLITHWSEAKLACAAAEASHTAAVVALFYLRKGECESIPLRVDRKTLAANGTHALYVDAGHVSVQTVNETRGQRPWVP